MCRAASTRAAEELTHIMHHARLSFLGKSPSCEMNAHINTYINRTRRLHGLRGNVTRDSVKYKHVVFPLNSRLVLGVSFYMRTVVLCSRFTVPRADRLDFHSHGSSRRWAVELLPAPGDSSSRSLSLSVTVSSNSSSFSHSSPCSLSLYYVSLSPADRPTSTC